MNLVKFEKIKKEINMADQICIDLNIDTLLNKIEYIFSNDFLSKEEKEKILNRYGEQISLACEHYLKSMIIPRIHYEGIASESEEELNKIFANKGNDGIRGYSHFFDRLLTSENSALKKSAGLQEAILIRLAERLKLKEYYDYSCEMINCWLNDDQTKYERLKTILINKMKEEINKNKDAYPQSRYSVFTEYIADTKFLINFCLILREMIARTINHCMYFEAIGRHIFPDVESSIIIKTKNGNEFEYAFHDLNSLELLRYNQVDIKILTEHELFTKFPPEIGRSIHSVNENNYIKDVQEIYYTENGLSYVLKYDDVMKMFIKNNIDVSCRKHK